MIRARAYEAMGDALFWRAVRALYARIAERLANT